MEKVAKRFKIDSTFSIRYRVREGLGQTSMHTASFIRALGEKGKNEFLLGINSLHTDSLLCERNEALRNENQRLEQINYSIIESVAKIVEARDGGSGRRRKRETYCPCKKDHGTFGKGNNERLSEIQTG